MILCDGKSLQQEKKHPPKYESSLTGGPVPSKDISPLPPPSFDPIFMEDVQCAETNEKLIFRCLVLSYGRFYNKISSKIGRF